MTTPEGRVKAKVSKMLKELLRTYKFMPVQNGMGSPALDYYCCVNGKFVAIETKIPGKKLTPRQETTTREIRAAGGTVFVIRDEHDVALARRHLEWIIAGNHYDPYIEPKISE
jgi:hypothetical protein